MEFCKLFGDYLSNIPDFYCCDCFRLPATGSGYDCQYHCEMDLDEVLAYREEELV